MSEETGKEAVSEESALKEGETYATDEQNQWFRNLVKENGPHLMPILKKLESDLADAYIDFYKESCTAINRAAAKSDYKHSHVSIPGSLQWAENTAQDLSAHVLKGVMTIITNRWEAFQKDPSTMNWHKKEDMNKIFH